MLASDEAYSELYFAGEPPRSALQVADRSHVAVFNTLSKRSSMPGYRSGFVAGDPEIVAALKKYRPNVGVAPLEFVQRAAVAAWGDEAHVDEVRERYRAKREALLPALEALGLRDAGGDATFFLWLDAGPDADALAARWLEAGVVVAPGLVLRRARLPADRARPTARGLRARRRDHPRPCLRPVRGSRAGRVVRLDRRGSTTGCGRRPAPAFVDELVALAPARVLDVGCGTGKVARALHGARARRCSASSSTSGWRRSPAARRRGRDRGLRGLGRRAAARST